MVEHAENFLSLYAVDMDAALEIQSPESWDSFPLFQLLNDFLRLDCEQAKTFRSLTTFTGAVFYCRGKCSHCLNAKSLLTFAVKLEIPSLFGLNGVNEKS